MQRLRLLLKHAYDNVLYYRQVLKTHGLKPQDVKSMIDLTKLPILTKDYVKQNFSEFIARGFPKYIPIATATGGSTGEPLRFYIDVKTSSIGLAALWRSWRSAGYRLGDKMAVLAGLSLVPERLGLIKRISDIINRKLSLPAMNIRKEILEQYARATLNFKPKFLRGYPSSLYFFADFLEDAGIKGIRPKAVLTTAEMLLPHQRKQIEEVFQCKVYDGYGAFDGGTAAFECEEHNGYHMAIEKTIMEFVDEDGNHVGEGEKGRIIATDLFNHAMPFIRYDTGDVGVYSNEECSCGRKLPIMKKILGRTTDILKFKNGVVLSGPSLTLVFKDFDIRQYQVVQTTDSAMVIRMIRGKTYTDAHTKKVYQIFKEAVGEDVEVKFDFVESIPTTKSGKWKIVIKEVE